MRTLGLEPQTGLALTGVKGRLKGKASGPRLAFIGELDSLRTSDHPLADPHTGAAHSCGHNAQIAGMLGVAMGLSAIGASDHLAGELVFFAVPAEEFIDVEERLRRKERGEIEFLLGKPELVAKDHFDDIDMAMMIHVGSHDQMAKRSYIADSSNGAVVKQIRFLGRASHAGGAPQLGINALSAAMIALNAIHAQRETFYDRDTIRIHPIITKGGDAVSVVPAEVHMETFVRGGSREAILDANMKVDRCLRAGAMAMGAEVEINTIPGYLPQRNNREMAQVFGGNVETLFGPGSFDIGGHRTGSTDMGDITHLKPVIHPVSRLGRRQDPWRRFSDQRAGARLSDPGQAAGHDRNRPVVRRRRAGEEDSRRVQTGDDQRQLPCVRTRLVPNRALQARGIRLIPLANIVPGLVKAGASRMTVIGS